MIIFDDVLRNCIIKIRGALGMEAQNLAYNPKVSWYFRSNSGGWVLSKSFVIYQKYHQIEKVFWPKVVPLPGACDV